MQKGEGEQQAEQLTVQANGGTPEHLKQEGQQVEEEEELQAVQLNGQANAEHLKQEAAQREVREQQESYDDQDCAMYACCAQADVRHGVEMMEERETCQQELLQRGKRGEEEKSQNQSQNQSQSQSQDQNQRVE